MSKKTITLDFIKRESLAEDISELWVKWDSQRQAKKEEWEELRNYVFATDTSTTTNSALPWKNSTTLPKLCQIRDNLHSNYLSALFPNDSWLKWEGYSQDDSTKDKAESIEAYMANKTRIGGFRETVSRLLYDYIDYGNVFGTREYLSSYRDNGYGDRIPIFIGPKAKRISPLDIVFNPTASSFEEAPKIVRAIKSLAELYGIAEDDPEQAYLRKAIATRAELKNQMGSINREDLEKADGYTMDGFGNFHEYLDSGYIEILEFYGDIYNKETGELLRSQLITIADRSYVLRHVDMPTWEGYAPIYHAAWRLRPDNLWGMGPLDNLVGMQYRIDHLENLKADAMDLAVYPPLVIAGEVEEFNYAPGEEIHIDENGSVTELARNVQWVIQADNEINMLEQRMEMYSGAPREAMGVRSPGEKTMFEVQQLQNAAGRIFQEKITSFELFLEKILNSMLAVSVQNFDNTDVVRLMDDDLGVEVFKEVTKDDITASGKIRPIGARHFAAQAQLLQNLQGIYNSPIGQMIMPHTSAINMSKVVEEIVGIERYKLFSPNVAIFEQQETARLANQASEDLEVEASMPVEE